jgi:TolB-like protein
MGVMKNTKEKSIVCGMRWVGVLALLLGSMALAGAQTNPVHIAVVSFSAPLGNRDLQATAAAFPDLLTTALSRDDRFTLVERDKIAAVWSEYHLTEAGLESAATVVKLGQTLSCDWLVSGLFTQKGTNRQVWIKIIDTQSSVVLDLQEVPYFATNFSVTAAAIGDFLAQARTRSKPREFVALEEFRDLSVSSSREDITTRLTAMIESNLLATGYGVVERADVSPIFSEYQLQSAGMTADDSKRVKLKPVFWTVGGNWKWFYDTQNKLSVTLNIQGMQGGEQVTNFAGVPGEALDKAVLSGLQTALKCGSSLTAQEALAGEVKLREARVDEAKEFRDGHAPNQRFLDKLPPTTVTITNSDGKTQVMTVNPEMIARWETHYRETLNSLHQAILLNSKDMKSKFMLAQMSYYDGTNSEEAKIGDGLLEEIIASKDPIFAKRAEYWRDDIRSGKISYKRSAMGIPTIVLQGNPASYPTAHAPSAQELAEAKARADKAREVTNVVAWAENKMNISRYSAGIAYLDGAAVSAYFVGKTLDRGPLFIARGTNLATFDWTRPFGGGSGADFQNFELPIKLEHPITAICGDESGLWLGTDGEGLIKIPTGGGAPVLFGEKDGFPMSSIRSLAMTRGKLFIGFGRGRDGAFGYLDLATSKFTGLMAPVIGAGKEDDTFPPPPPRNAVYQIRASKGTNDWWIGCDLALYHFKPDSQEWALELPKREQRELTQMAGLQTLTAAGDYVANILYPGIGIHKISESRWTHLNLATNFVENIATAVAIDGTDPNYLWVGSPGKISIIDLRTQQMVGQYKIQRRGRVRLIMVFEKDVFFLQDEDLVDSYVLQYWPKPSYP